MKKILSLVLVLMMAALLLSSAALADGSLAITLGSGTMDETARTVTIPIHVTGNPGVAYLSLTLQYPTDVFESASVVNGGMFDGFSSGANYTWDAQENVIATGTLGTITLKVKDGAPAGSYTVTAVVQEAYNYDEEAVTAAVVPTTVTIPGTAHEHTWDEGEITTPATCTEAGVKTFHCTASGCAETKTEPIAAKGHTWDEGEVTTPATCTEAGVKTFHCTASGCTETKTEPIAAKGHTWDEGEVTTPATCTEAGVKTFHCAASGCTETKTEAIAAKGHTWDEGKVTREATAEAEGEKTYTCKVCQATKTEAIAKLAPSGGGSKPAGGKKSGAPQTGDESHAVLWLAICLGACACGAVLVRTKRKVN